MTKQVIIHVRIQGMVLPTRRSTKTIVATNDLRRTFDDSGKDGKED